MPFKDFAPGEVLTSSDVDTYLMSQVIIRCTSATRPASPAQGWHIYETDTGRFLVYNGTSWIPEGGTRFAYKTADETVTSSTTRQNDDHLYLPLLANSKYYFELFLAYSAATAGISIEFSVPSGSTIYWGASGIPQGQDQGGWGYVSGYLAGSSPVTGLTSLSFSSFGAYNLPVRGVVSTAGTAGNLQLLWAQSTASSSTILRANSCMQVTQM